MRAGRHILAAIVALCVLALLEAAASNQFYTNGRYGKRVPGPAISDEEDSNTGAVARVWTGTTNRRRSDVEPRTDKFFLNSRYGKRASMDPLVAGGWLQTTDSVEQARGVDGSSLMCHYTGVHDLYRCIQSPRKLNANNLQISSSNSKTSDADSQN